MAKKKFKVKTGYTFFGKIVRRITRIVKRRPAFIGLDEKELDEKCIIIANHNGAGGPFTYKTFLDKKFMIWGAHQMCEGYHSRRKYLYHIFYRQKLGYSKFKAFLLSISYGLISRLTYNYAGIIPVYYDLRVGLTYRYSIECLNKGVATLIFPENSSGGYKENIEEFYSGFLHLAKMYYLRYGEDLPIYTMYYNKKPKTIVIGKPMYLQELLKEHDEKGIADIFRNYLNSLRSEVPEKGKKKKSDKSDGRLAA